MAVKRYTFEGTLALTGALHIGSGGGGGNVDATVVRDSAGRPYVPGSSLRGALRAAIGQYAPQLGLGEIREDGDIQSSVDQVLPPSAMPVQESEIQTRLNNVLTSAERLFGTVWWSSPLKIPDLYPTEPQPELGEVRHGVGIDRDTGAARDGAKYDFEVLPRGIRFALHMTLEVPDEPSNFAHEWSQQLALGLRLLELGDLPLGGRLARGVGQVSLRDLQVNILDLSDPRQLLAALTASDTQMGLGTPEPAGWTTRQLQTLGEVA